MSATPQTKRSIVAHSPAGHLLLDALEALQAEFCAAAESGATLPPGAIVLAPVAELEPPEHDHCNGYHMLRWMDADRWTGLYVQREIGPTGKGEAPHPYWYGEETRRDEMGRIWTRRLRNLVMDDFGMLVEVPQ